MEKIKQLFAQKDTTLIAKSLLGMYLEHETAEGTLGGYIVECEAYLGPEDAAAHSFQLRKTPRLVAMYEGPGTIYLYKMHTHLLLNFVTQEAGHPQGILIRGLEPVDGIALMEQNRAMQLSANLTNGPGKLVRALNIQMDLYGQSLFDSSLRLVPEKQRTPREICAVPRIGIPNKGEWTERPLRYIVAGNPYVTNMKKSAIDQNHGWWRKEEK